MDIHPKAIKLFFYPMWDGY